ncbi:MAG TPA: TauD/TfdA family dioxygenase [Casimicrobiaceae bacterium]
MGLHSALTGRAARAANPFDLDDDAAYRRWRDAKLAGYPVRGAGEIVEIGNPRALTRAEREAIVERCRRANFAIYAGPPSAPDKEIARGLGRALGLARLDWNWLADDDGISSLRVTGERTRADFIPYTNRPINWHTDGYYNPPERTIRAMVLHCVTEAIEGGENALIDHEIVYLLLRDADPSAVHTLSASDVMSIPARIDDTGVARAEETGPVFSVDARSGDLHMRYTARTRSIAWKQDPATRSALARLEAIFADDSPYVHRVRLASGMGVIANNVPHNRAGFRDRPDRPRLLYRARYYDRVAGTGSAFAREP